MLSSSSTLVSNVGQHGVEFLAESTLFMDEIALVTYSKMYTAYNSLFSGRISHPSCTIGRDAAFLASASIHGIAAITPGAGKA